MAEIYTERSQIPSGTYVIFSNSGSQNCCISFESEDNVRLVDHYRADRQAIGWNVENDPSGAGWRIVAQSTGGAVLDPESSGDALRYGDPNLNSDAATWIIEGSLDDCIIYALYSRHQLDPEGGLFQHNSRLLASLPKP